MRTSTILIAGLLLSAILINSVAVLAQTDEPLFPARVKDLYGYINLRGEMVIKPQFDQAQRFHDGLALVETGGKALDDAPNYRMFGKRGYIDKTGKFVIAPGKFTFAKDFSEGLAAVWIKSPCSGSCYGYIDTTGKVVLPQKYQTAGAFRNGTADVRMADDKWGVIDRKGKFIIPPKYDGVFPFYNEVGLAILIKNKKESPFDQSVDNDFAVELYDRTGSVIARKEQFVFGSFESGLAPLLTKGGIGFVDTRGDLKIAVGFTGALGFSEGLCPVSINRRWGYIDTNGKIVVEFQFEKAYGFSEGLAVVEINGKQGYIDHTGKFVIEPRDWQLSGFENGLAFVRQGDFYGYIDKTGKFVWKENDD